MYHATNGLLVGVGVVQVAPDAPHYSALIAAAGLAGHTEFAFEILEDMCSEGLSLGPEVCSALIYACCLRRQQQIARKVYDLCAAKVSRPHRLGMTADAQHGCADSFSIDCSTRIASASTWWGKSPSVTSRFHRPVSQGPFALRTRLYTDMRVRVHTHWLRCLWCSLRACIPTSASTTG